MEQGGVFKERNFVCCYVIFSIIKRRTTTILRRNDEMVGEKQDCYFSHLIIINDYFTELLSVIDVGKMKNDNPLASELHKLTRRGSFQKADRM